MRDPILDKVGLAMKGDTERPPMVGPGGITGFERRWLNREGAWPGQRLTRLVVVGAIEQRIPHDLLGSEGAVARRGVALRRGTE